jgi:heat shock protein HslJ
MKKTVIILIIALPAIVSCSNKINPAMTSQDTTKTLQVDTGRWYLKTVYKHDGKIAVSGNRAWLNIDTAGNRAGGKGSCNSFGSTMKMEGNSISFTNIFSTKMYCEDVQPIENAYLDLLSKVDRFSMSDKTLQLYKGDELLLEFEKR